MEKISYIEYSDTIAPGNQHIEVIVQIPVGESEQDPEGIHIKINSQSTWKTFTEWTAINEVIRQALEDAGWVYEEVKPDTPGS